MDDVESQFDLKQTTINEEIGALRMEASTDRDEMVFCRADGSFRTVGFLLVRIN
jgi:hypothetical protein